MTTRTMMLVEDNLDERILIKRQTKKQNIGLHIIEAHDGEQAIHQLAAMPKEELPSLILLDLKMPKLDGHQVLKWIRHHKDTQHLPVVMFSTSDDKDDIARSYELGANSYIIKNINQNCLDILCVYWTEYNQTPS